ncbi:MAG: hypothetical protein HYY45_04180 [Deltaproteobacteria bacterium]|nr:hypothetical protein [Deltaproteobacteria bacterium]
MRRRLDRLTGNRTMQVVAVMEPGRLRSRTTAARPLQLDPSRVKAMAHELAANRQV